LEDFMKTCLLLSLGLLLAGAGCASTDSTANAKEKGVLGAVGGAVIGGVIGHQSGKGLEGAAVGAAAGGVLGAAAGSAQDERETQSNRR